MNLEREWDKTYYLKNSGLEVDAVMQDDGTVTAQSIDPTGQTLGMADVFGGGVKPDIYALSQAAGAPVTEAEVGGTMAGAAAGIPGAIVTGLQDLGALIYGGGKAALAETGQGVEEFLKGFSTISGAIGSEALGGLFDSTVDKLNISDEAKQGLKQGYLAGEFASMGLVAPKAAKAGTGAVVDYAAGAPARLEEAKSGVTLGMGVDPTQVVDEAIVGAQKLMGEASQVEAHPNRIATRLPTAVRATENPIDEPLQIGLAESKADPVQFEHNVKIVQDYPNMTEAQSQLPPEQASEEFITHVKDNLLWIHDKIPDETRQRSKLWYEGARAITDKWSAKYNLPDASIAGTLAALSPQMDWYKNVSLAERVITTMANRDVPASKEMIAFAKQVDSKGKPKLAEKFQPIVDDMLGKTLNDLDSPLKRAIFVRLYDEVNNSRTHNIISPEGDLMEIVKRADGSEAGTGWGSFVEITKAVEAVESGGDKAVLTPLMGTQHKVRSFYNNILDPNGPNGDVTIDTHAVAAGLLKPLSGQATEVHHNFGSAPFIAQRSANWKGATKNSSVTGVQGNYGLYAEAYRRAAKERGILPREMQSITWEAARGLFTDVYKRAKKDGEFVNVKAVDSFWQKYRKGEMTIDEVRDAIEQHAGGINPPTWKQ